MADGDGTPSGLGGGPTIDLSRLVGAAQATTQALNNLNQTISRVFPQGSAVTSTAGAGAGKYLTIIGPDGVTYKIALLLTS